MKKWWIFLIIVVGIFLFSNCSEREPVRSETPSENPVEDEPSGPTLISGRISGEFTRNNSPYRVVGNIVVETGRSLVVEPGVSIQFYPGIRMTVRGLLDVRGEKDNMVTFTAFDESWKGITFDSADSSTFKFTVIEQVYLEGNDINQYGALNIEHSTVAVYNSIFTNNYVQYGGGIAAENSTVVVKNSLFTRNHSIAYGGAIYGLISHFKLINNTFYQNYVQNVGGGVVLIAAGITEIQNNIFFQNEGTTGNPSIYITLEYPDDYNEGYNFFHDSQANPLFLSQHDFHLDPASPCINRGNPAERYNDVNGTRNDQGAYGGPGGDW